MAALARFILWLLSLIYRLAIAVWNLRWKIGPQVKLKSKVISVGNLAVGGTGKTPLVIYIAQLALQAGYKTAVVARGYKRESSGLIELHSESTWQEVGDEPLEVLYKAVGARVYVDKSKTDAAVKASTDAAEVIIIDDGFQHRKLHRDLDIVCLDWQKPLGPDGMLPSGTLREPVRALKRADAIVYTSYDKEISPIDLLPDKYEIPNTFYITSEITGFFHLQDNAALSIDEISKERPVAFCGLADPAKFRTSLLKAGITPSVLVIFRDHHGYTQADYDDLCKKAEAEDTNCLITTFKDAVKIRSLDLRGFDVYSAQLEIAIGDESGIDESDRFKEFLGL